MSYVIRNVSYTTSLAVNADRAIIPVGTLIHTTEGANSLAWLQGGSANAGKPASADCLIGRAGERWLITPVGRYAYHAGTSYYRGAKRYTDNEVSQALMGIELERQGDEPITYEQVDSCADQIVRWGELWGWRWPYVILGHYAVARPLGRRSDPVNLDWGSLMGRLYAHAKEQAVLGL